MGFLSRASDLIVGHLRETREHPIVRRLLSAGHWVLLALIVALLLYRLSQIGWSDVFTSIPASPWFFVFFFLRYFTLPLSESAIYEIIWERPLAGSFPAFVRKRVYNNAVAGYSGEGFLALWARRALGLSGKAAVIAIKDNNILSSLAANISTIVIIAALALTGGLSQAISAMPGSAALVAFATIVAAAMALIVIFFGKHLVAMKRNKVWRVLSIHAVRQVATLVLFAAMYAAALPGVSLNAILLFIGLQLVISRVPFLPNQDLVYLTAALSIHSIIGAPAEVVAGMLVAEAGLSQLLSVALFFATAHLARRAGAPNPLKAADVAQVEAP
ncbi:MAG TPA: hypothetical protein VNH64_04710 [Parvularculaceae bacterium]|nr:hypothetical protein [Parvularculaceae bacterium]